MTVKLKRIVSIWMALMMLVAFVPVAGTCDVFASDGAKATKKKGVRVNRHLGLRYESTNASIATVSKAGRITGKKKGSCYIYCFAQNGIAKRVKVTVR